MLWRQGPKVAHRAQLAPAGAHAGGHGVKEPLVVEVHLGGCPGHVGQRLQQSIVLHTFIIRPFLATSFLPKRHWPVLCCWRPQACRVASTSKLAHPHVKLGVVRQDGAGAGGKDVAVCVPSRREGPRHHGHALLVQQVLPV